MSRILVGRPLQCDELCEFTVTAEQAKRIDKQITLLVEYQLATFNVYKTMREQMQELARNCYMQGVLDGNQVPRKE